MSNFIDNDISLFINDKNKDKFSKDFNNFCKDKNEDFNNKFRDKSISRFAGIENNISICYKFQNDFNDYFQDKNNKNINDYKSVFVSVKNNKNKDENVKDFHSFCKDKRINFKDNFGNDFSNDFSNIVISLFTDIRNNINVCIVEVPNETAPSIQGFAKPPA